MMQQYEAIKAQYSDCILLFRLGDFYEMFGDDAVKASKILNITLTKRNKGAASTMPMCGVPYHSIEGYIAKLTRHGEKVAMCDQVSDPKLPGIVKREVVRVITPGTTLNESILDNKTNNYLISIIERDGVFGLCYVDITTGDFAVTQIGTLTETITEISKISPAECILEDDLFDGEKGALLRDTFDQTFFSKYSTFRNAQDTLKDHFRVKTLNGFGLEDKDVAIEAAGFVMNYLFETQKTDLSHIKKISYFSISKYMPIDEATLRNLELLYTLRDRQKDGSLISIIDNTLTAMGGRMLKFWLTHPLQDVSEINERLNAIEEIINKAGIHANLRAILKDIVDIERIMAKLSLESGNARDLLALKSSLEKITELKSETSEIQSEFLQNLRHNFVDMKEITSLIDDSIAPEPPILLTNGGIIRDGFNEKLDKLKNISREGKSFIKDLQEKEIKRTGISSLKVKYNRVFGYYIEISNANMHLAPEDYIRKQTLVNAERFITPELKEYEETVLTAEEKIIELEQELFAEIRQQIIQKTSEIQKNANIFATFDVICGLAYTAQINNYTKPIVDDKNIIDIENGRHPVVEKMSFAGNFIPNNTKLSNENDRLLLITGPNMGGKSTILRQTALIVLMAHIGSFVPASKAKIGLIDRIFTRVGASDNLIKGQSTFMVEMQEAANILNHATSKSLIILDEIGRGTSTYDGVSIAWAITEYIHNTIQAKTMFATHYHELIAVAESLPHAKNLCITAKESDNKIIFLYKLEEGGIDKSYGIEVAKLAGLPQEVIDKSNDILEDLEKNVIDKNIENALRDTKKNIPESQMDLFGNTALLEEFERKTQNLRKIKDDIAKIDINHLTPIEALQKLDELKRKSNNN
ncbi:DNA mismatch repair protein MutS [Patescibacteria group bacterium]|nr:DNA mismatch repair protein MutS [Patescibacteria group bacterium]